MFSFTILLHATATFATLASSQATQIPEPSSAAGDALTVDLGYVKYLGYSNTSAGINYFRGIHYAANPTGSLRWQKPRPIEASNDFGQGTIYNATKIGPACYQSQPKSIYMSPEGLKAFIKTPGESEDCLTLDVLVPTTPTSSQLPVLVQIHGGGYTEGSAQSYPGDALVNASNGNLIYVSIQYRLGIFGFLAGAEIAQNGNLNTGLLDQRAALEWIQRNIRAFGGDPSRVTIWGGSAGGGSVTTQLIAGGAYDEPPFSAAIAEYPWWQPYLNQSQQQTQFTTALRLSRCDDLNCLRALPETSLASLGQLVQNASYPTGGNGYGVFYFGPVVDGDFIKELPSEAFGRGHYYDVPLLVDRNAFEGVPFSNVSQTTQLDERADAEIMFPFAGPAFFSRLFQDLYPISDYNSTFFQRQTWFGDFIINCPTYYMASNAVDHNINSSAVFKMTFAAGSQVHGATAPFLASASVGWPGANNYTLAKIMSSYWTSFAITHDPNPLRSSDAPYWPSYASTTNTPFGKSVGFNTLAITYNSIGPVKDPDASAKCDFFAKNQYQVMN